MSRPSLILVDWFQTLSWSIFWPEWKETEDPVQRRLAVEKDRFFVEEQERVREWMRGRETTESVCQSLAERSETPVEFVQDELARTCREMTVVPGAFEEIGRLRALGIRVVLVTDNMDPFTRWVVPDMKLENVFDEILSSDQTGLLKNDRDEHSEPILFTQTLRRHGRAWHEVLLIDDSAGRYADLGLRGLRIEIPRSPEDTLRILKSIN